MLFLGRIELTEHVQSIQHFDIELCVKIDGASLQYLIVQTLAFFEGCALLVGLLIKDLNAQILCECPFNELFIGFAVLSKRIEVLLQDEPRVIRFNTCDELIDLLLVNDSIDEVHVVGLSVLHEG